MNFDSFITPPTNKQSHIKNWALWSLLLTSITIGSIIVLHRKALKRYTACTKTCRMCEKIATGATNDTLTNSSLAESYKTITEQATALRTHKATKGQLVALARTLLSGIQTPAVLQTLNLTLSESTLTVRCPRTYSLTKLTQQLAAHNPDTTFFVTRLDQHDDGVLITLSAQRKTTN